MTETEQFIHNHQAQIDEAEFLSRYGRTHPEAREECADKIGEIYEELEREAEE